MKDILVWVGVFAIVGAAVVVMYWAIAKAWKKIQSARQAPDATGAAEAFTAAISSAVENGMTKAIGAVSNTATPELSSRDYSKELSEICKLQLDQMKVMISIAQATEDSSRSLRRIARSYEGAGLEEMTDPRAREIDEIDALISNYGIPREEAEARIKTRRVYNPNDFGARR